MSVKGMLPLTMLHNLLGCIDSANQLVVANHDVMPLWKRAYHFLSWRGQTYFESHVKCSRSPCKM